MKITTNNDGFTLIEVLISIAVSSIGLLAMASVSIAVMKSNSTTGHRTKALILAQDKVEELINLEFNDPQLINDGDNTDISDSNTPDHINAELANPAATTNIPIDPAGNTGNAKSVYSRFWNITDASPTLKTLAVMVTWTDVFGAHVVTITTVKSS